ncbi:valine--tRNA ligase, mitochondrial 1 isoform X2 [Triticum aestivum]|uniref:valine--tRNA ligase, mitochondrial 1 isoform X2 n=1 Tax=Triticum aestivum TaxID=4565 RepID=UPI0003D41DF3|nr:valine--tRNA ligase, mitochondrial 1-like isoform X2 [Triticum aestivum]
MLYLQPTKKYDRQKVQTTSAEKKARKKQQSDKAVEDDSRSQCTPNGQKKLLSPKMDSHFHPSLVEQSWYSWWESAHYFGADSTCTKPPFVMVLSPQDVEGDLSHAYTVAIQDAMIRWRRMSGYNALLVPGVGHADMPTEVCQSKARCDRNMNLRRLGVSVDWSREVLTMDEKRSKAVTEAFVSFHKAGLIRRDCRLVKNDCTPETTSSDTKGLYKDMLKNEMSLGVHSGTNDVVEPMLKSQWFLNGNTMAKAAHDALKSKQVEIIPQHYEEHWHNRENINDWCVSRQLPWGHRVPAWYVTLEDDHDRSIGYCDNRWVVARSEKDANLEAQKKYPGKKFQLDQDPDVLDTWFLSSLIPLMVCGWPADMADFRDLYPTSVLVTGYDTPSLWVERTVMMGMQLVGNVPFQKSESLGSNISLLEVMTNGMSLEKIQKHVEDGDMNLNELNIRKEMLEKDLPDGIPECGIDAVCFALISCSSQVERVNFDIRRVIRFREGCSKLWKAFRFALEKLGDQYVPPTTVDVSILPPICKWILSVLNKTIVKTVTCLEVHKFSDASSAVYSWWQHQMRIVFIESIKCYFADRTQSFECERAAIRDTLWICLDSGLRLLHPFMPYITEELWQRLPQPKGSSRKDSIMISEYPSHVKEWTDDELEKDISIVLDVVQKIKLLKLPTDTNERRTAFALCQGEGPAYTLQCHQSLILSLCSVSHFKILRENDQSPVQCVTAAVNEEITVYVQNADARHEKLGEMECVLQYRHAYEETHPDIELEIASPYPPDDGCLIERIFLTFLRGYLVNKQKYYVLISEALKMMNSGDMPIVYSHVLQFDARLASTIKFFFGRVQKNLINAATIFLKEDVDYKCENLSITISNIPRPCSLLSLKDFWKSSEHKPAVERDIYSAETCLRLTTTTPSGRIPLLNLLKKICSNFERGKSWNGQWNIEDVIVYVVTYQVDILKPFSSKCNHSTLAKDLMVVIKDIIPEFRCGGNYPSFFGKLIGTLQEYLADPSISGIRWNEFNYVLFTHFAIKSPLAWSTFLDDLHEVFQSLGDRARGLLQHLLSKTERMKDWRFVFEPSEAVHPVLAIVYEHNRKKKEKISREREGAIEDDRNTSFVNEDDSDVGQTDLQASQALVEGVQAGDEEKEILYKVVAQTHEAWQIHLQEELQALIPGAQTNEDLDETVVQTLAIRVVEVLVKEAHDAGIIEDKDAHVEVPVPAEPNAPEVPVPAEPNAPEVPAPTEPKGAKEANILQEDSHSSEVPVPAEPNAPKGDKKIFPFPESPLGLLICSRHTKQHGSIGARDKKGRQLLKTISEVVLIIGHYLEDLAEIPKALIYNLDRFKKDVIDNPNINGFNADDFEEFILMFTEILEQLDTPEVSK